MSLTALPLNVWGRIGTGRGSKSLWRRQGLRLPYPSALALGLLPREQKPESCSSSPALKLEHYVFKVVIHFAVKLTNYVDLPEVTCLISGFSPSWARTQSCSKVGLVNHRQSRPSSLLRSCSFFSNTLFPLHMGSELQQISQSRGFVPILRTPLFP